jgi:outer membrane biosynthesis protein TonB
MIAVASSSGQFLKGMPELSGGGVLGYHSVLGWVSEAAARERWNTRRKRGLVSGSSDASEARFSAGWRLRLKWAAGTEGLVALDGCQVKPGTRAGAWPIESAFGAFQILEASPDSSGLGLSSGWEQQQGNAGDERWLKRAGAVAALLVLLLWFLPKPSLDEAEPEVLPAPVSVRIVEEKAVAVPKYEAPVNALPQAVAQAQPTQEARRAIQQNLGFLGLLGKKDLSKALGGAPTALKDASPGAGAGGKQGSGGEYLVGLGQGVKRATVGNTGVAGLGGVGTKGAGGGAGGYGNALVGSGEGRGLSAMPVSQELVLEGGLDRAVIQATIAKYLSQVRACYEEGLRSQPGLAGQVSVAFEIAAEGQVSSSRVSRSSLNHAGVETCITTRMMDWKFPKPRGGVGVKVNYPFVLRPVG